MVNQPLLLRCKHALIHARAVPWLVALRQVVELIDIDIVRLQESQRSLQILPESLRGLGMGLGGDIDLFPVEPTVSKGSPQFLLAVRIGSGGVKIPHAALIGPPQKLHSVLL